MSLICSVMELASQNILNSNQFSPLKLIEMPLIYSSLPKKLIGGTSYLSVCVTSSTAMLALFLRRVVDPSFAGLALAYATQLSGIFQYTVRLSTETEARFTSVQRLDNCSKVNVVFA